jgi:hypothetical protein
VLREGWDFIESENTRLLREMTVQGSLQQWSRLQRAFEWQLQQTAELFEQERREALIELQARINRLIE